MKKPDHQILVIFGASGDLTRRKLIPALYELYRQNLLPGNFAVLGASRTEMSDDEFRKKMYEFLPEGEARKEFGKFLYYQTMDTEGPNDYMLLKDRLDQLDQ